MDSMTYEKLQRVMKGLFGDGTHLTPDRRRDLANAMFAALNEVIPYPTSAQTKS